MTSAVPRGSLDKTMRHEMFGSSDESDHSPRESKPSRSLLYDTSAKHEEFNHNADADDSSRSHHSRKNPSDCGDRGAIISVGNAQEEQDRNTLQTAPEKNPWMSSQINLKRR